LLAADAETADSVLAGADEVLALRPALRAGSIRRLRAGAITQGPVFEYLSADSSAEALAALVADAREPGSSGAAISALVERGDPASRAALDALSREAAGEAAAEALCARFRKPDARARAALVAAESERTRVATAAALLSIDAPEAEAPLTRLSRSESADERRAAAHLIGRFGSLSYERQLTTLVTDADYGVAITSLRALSRLGAGDALRTFAKDTGLREDLKDYAEHLLEHGEQLLPRRRSRAR
jgi:hypothetical protein